MGTYSLKNIIQTAGFLLTLIFFLPASHADTYKMYVGDMQTLNVGSIKRVAIGNGKLMSSSILENGNLLILAEKEGDTELNVWLENGKKISHKIYITKADSNRTSSEAIKTMKNIPGLSTRKVGQNIVIEGVTNEVTSKMIDTVAAKYSDIINLTVKFNLEDIIKLIEEVPALDIQVKKIAGFAVVTGSVDTKGKAALDIIKGLFPEIVDLTVEDKITVEPMVYLKVQITEFNTSALENLGINWTTSFAGPSIGYTHDFRSKGNTTTFANIGATALQEGDASTLAIRGYESGFFGIATLITSAINIAVSSGDALILASPTLSAKSGGAAEFLSGGQVPVPVPGPNQTTTIEYKDYGISLNIEPKAGITGNITAKVETEISSIDQSVSFGNVPGFRNRSAKTEVNLKDGETLVISGLVNREMGNDVSQIKWLGDIPILGALFRSTNFRNNRSDLVIFITPHIVDANSQISVDEISREKELRNKFIKSIDEDAEILD